MFNFFKKLFVKQENYNSMIMQISRLSDIEDAIAKFNALTGFDINDFLELYKNGVLEIKTSKAYSIESLIQVNHRFGVDSIVKYAKNVGKEIEENDK